MPAGFIHPRMALPLVEMTLDSTIPSQLIWPKTHPSTSPTPAIAAPMIPMITPASPRVKPTPPCFNGGKSHKLDHHLHFQNSTLLGFGAVQVCDPDSVAEA